MGDEPLKMPSPEELTLLSMQMMKQLTAELHQLNDQMKLNRELNKEIRDLLVGNANVTEALGRVLTDVGDVAESIYDVLDIHADAMQIMKDSTGGQSRITLTDYARAWFDASDGDSADSPAEDP